MDLSKYSDAVRDRLRADYVGNETDTDQYRETQPAAGLSMVSDLLERASTMSDAASGVDVGTVMTQVATWAAACDGSYGGAEEIAPLYGQYFDLLWKMGDHPYASTLEEIDQWLADTTE